MSYTIQTTDTQGHWYIVGSERCLGDAQDAMERHRKLFSKKPVRVVEARTRRLVVLHDPNVEED